MGFLSALGYGQKDEEQEATLGQGDMSLALWPPTHALENALMWTRLGSCSRNHTKPYRKSHVSNSMLFKKRREIKLSKQYWFLIYFGGKCGDWNTPMKVRIASCQHLEGELAEAALVLTDIV